MGLTSLHMHVPATPISDLDWDFDLMEEWTFFLSLAPATQRSQGPLRSPAQCPRART